MPPDALRGNRARPEHMLQAARDAVAIATNRQRAELDSDILLRHILVHDYFKIDHVAVWRVVTEHIPAMIPVLEAALSNWPPGET